MSRRLVAVPMLLAASVALLADDPPYKRGDTKRPRPPVVTPAPAGDPVPPPADAVVLFDGKGTAAWKTSNKVKDGGDDGVKWKVEGGYLEVVPKTGRIQTRETFGDAQFHVEWATPREVSGTGQGRGNSGVHLGGFGELQVLDSFENDTYPDGQAAALYGRLPPRVNASRKPGEWQTYDIVAELPRADAAGKVTRHGRVTVLHNGVLVHHAVEFDQKIAPYPLQLSDHRNPVRFRNVWARRLKGYDEPK